MTHQYCPRCGLTLKLRASYLMVEHCPRCLGRAQIAIPMFPSGPLASREQTRPTATFSAEPSLSSRAAWSKAKRSGFLDREAHAPVEELHDDI